MQSAAQWRMILRPPFVVEKEGILFGIALVCCGQGRIEVPFRLAGHRSTPRLALELAELQKEAQDRPASDLLRLSLPAIQPNLKSSTDFEFRRGIVPSSLQCLLLS